LQGNRWNLRLCHCHCREIHTKMGRNNRETDPA
jgi:hypothetical protein